MSPLSPPLTVAQPTTGRGRGGLHPPIRGGGDDGKSGGPPDYGRRIQRARLGLIFALAPITALFFGLAGVYIFRHGTFALDPRTGTYVRHWIEVKLPIRLLLFNTFLLLLGSVTMEFARRQVSQQAALAPLRSIPGLLIGTQRGFPWLSSSLLFGLAFLAGQWLAWRELESHGFFLDTSASSAFVYLLTATHAVHLAAGIVALLYAQIIALMHKPVEFRRIVVDVTAWYWHFMALLWICIFAFLYFLR
jgi:cytochrome c oxidase subunit 3